MHCSYCKGQFAAATSAIADAVAFVAVEAIDTAVAICAMHEAHLNCHCHDHMKLKTIGTLHMLSQNSAYLAQLYWTLTLKCTHSWSVSKLF